LGWGFEKGEMATVATSGLGLGMIPKGDVRMGFRTGLLRYLGVTVGGASGMAIALGAYEVFRSQPDKSFALLQIWGPAFLIALLAIYVTGKFLEGLVVALRESFSMVANSSHDSAVAAGRQADALTKLAEQGSRDAEEVKRMAIYAAQEFTGVYERFDRQDDILRDLTHGVKGLHSMLSSEKAALDVKEKKEGERDGS